MIKREEVSNLNSCLNRAHDDEPVFVLRANDPIAAHVVEYWASAYVISKQDHGTDGLLTTEQHAKMLEARSSAAAMREWKRNNTMQRRRTSDESPKTQKAEDPFDNSTPVAWIRGHECSTHIAGVFDYAEEVVAGSRKPEGNGWTPLFTRAIK